MFNLEIGTDNAAFHDPYTGEEDNCCEAFEVCRILEEIQGILEDSCGSIRNGNIKDINGNKVGKWSFQD